MDDSSDIQELLAALHARPLAGARRAATAHVLRALVSGPDEEVAKLAGVLQTGDRRNQKDGTAHRRALIDLLQKWDGRSPNPVVMAQRLLDAGAQNMVLNSGHDLRPTGAEIDHSEEDWIPGEEPAPKRGESYLPEDVILRVAKALSEAHEASADEPDQGQTILRAACRALGMNEKDARSMLDLRTRSRLPPG